MEEQAVVSGTPTDAEHPIMYERTTYILGGIAGLCVLGVVLLSVLGRPIDAGLVAIGASAVGGLVALLTPRAA